MVETVNNKKVDSSLNLMGAYEDFYKGKETIKKGESIHKQLENHLNHNVWFQSSFPSESLDELVSVTKSFSALYGNTPLAIATFYDDYNKLFKINQATKDLIFLLTKDSKEWLTLPFDLDPNSYLFAKWFEAVKFHKDHTVVTKNPFIATGRYATFMDGKYKVYDSGVVVSSTRGKMAGGFKNDIGYHIQLHRCKQHGLPRENYKLPISALLAKAFLPISEEDKQIAFKDGNKHNLTLTNLVPVDKKGTVLPFELHVYDELGNFVGIK